MINLNKSVEEYLNRGWQGTGNNQFFTKIINDESVSKSEVAGLIIEYAVQNIKENIPLTNTLKYLSLRLFKLVENRGLEDLSPRDWEILHFKVGAGALGALKDLGLIQRTVIRIGGILQNFLVIVDKPDNPLKQLVENYQMDMRVITHTKWSKPVDGTGVTIVKKLDPKRFDLYTKEVMPEVYDALNTLGEVKMKVNRSVLDVVDKIVNEGHDYFPRCITQKELDEAREKVIIKDTKLAANSRNYQKFLQSKETGRSLAKKISRLNLKMKRKDQLAEELLILSEHGKYLSFKTIYSMAQNLKSRPFFKIKYSMDTRGRIYSNLNYLNPQGEDLAKALLQFSDGCEWNWISEYWIKVQAANLCGQDKMEFHERVKWTEDNLENFLKLAQDPLNSEWWLTFGQDDYWQILAVAFELYNMTYHKDTTQCQMPIAIDCTQSGYQLLASLGKDKEIARTVNVLPNEHVIGDAYLAVAKNLKVILDEKIKDPSLKDEYREFMQMLNKFTIKQLRPCVKRNTMTIAYSAGVDCCINQIYEDRRVFKIEELMNLNYKQCIWFGKLNYEAIEKTFSTPVKIMNFLISAVMERMKIDKNPLVSWNVPSGFTAYQYHSKMNKSTIRVKFGNETIRLQIGYDSGKINKMKHKKAIAANYVHSLDAALMVSVINKMRERGFNSFLGIHDSFSSSANGIAVLRECIQEAFRDVVSGDRLKLAIMQLSKGEMDDSEVEYGTLDIKNETLSDYIAS